MRQNRGGRVRGGDSQSTVRAAALREWRLSGLEELGIATINQVDIRLALAHPFSDAVSDVLLQEGEFMPVVLLICRTRRCRSP